MTDQEIKKLVSDVERLERVGQRLFALLDEIDTADDIAKENDAWFRKRVQYLQRKRFEVASTDGYTVTLLEVK
ncbi:MAG: hypothetical protein HRT80_16610 [Henriciella sp.]|nr:hypothetical protein [Henriciella sp.]